MNNFLKDKHGKVVIFQPPNLLIIVFIVTKVLDFIFDGGAGQLFAAIAFGTLFAWAWLEIFEGASYFRRILGAVVMAYLLLSKL